MTMDELVEKVIAVLQKRYGTDYATGTRFRWDLGEIIDILHEVGPKPVGPDEVVVKAELIWGLLTAVREGDTGGIFRNGRDLREILDAHESDTK